MKNEFDRAVDKVSNAAKDARDAVSEGVHKSKADAERERRTELGETMTTGQKAESVGNEVAHEAKAGFDRAKRDARDI